MGEDLARGIRNRVREVEHASDLLARAMVARQRLQERDRAQRQRERARERARNIAQRDRNRDRRGGDGGVNVNANVTINMDRSDRDGSRAAKGAGDQVANEIGRAIRRR